MEQSVEHDEADRRSTQVERAFGLLEQLALQGSGAQLQLLAEQLGIPRSATHRLLSQLVTMDYVRQDSERGVYRLTPKIVSLAQGYLASSGLAGLVQPILDRLADATGELVQMPVVDGDRLIWIAKAQGARLGLRYEPDMGMEAPLADSAVGVAWLSALSDTEALDLIARQRSRIGDQGAPRRKTPDNEVLDRLTQARRSGYAINIETFIPGVSAMAAPVRHWRTGAIQGAISLAGPSARLGEQRMKELAERLLAAASELATVDLEPQREP